MKEMHLMQSVEKEWTNGGFTLRLDGSCPEFGPDDYIVSMDCFEMASRQKPDSDAIIDYISKWEPLLEQDDHFLGGWVSDAGIYHLDISRRYRGLEAAMIIARKECQQAIYHPSSGQTIMVTEIADDWNESRKQLRNLVTIPSAG